MPDPLDLSHSGILDITKNDSIMNISRNEQVMGSSSGAAKDISNQYRVTVTQLATFNDGVDRNSYSFTNASWPANKVLCLVVATSAGGTPIPTVTGGGLTWESEVSQTIILGGQRITIFRARSTTAMTNQTLTISFAGATQNCCMASLLQLNNVYMDTGSNGDTAFGQRNSNTVLSGSTEVAGGLNSSGFENTYNATLAIILVRLNSVSVTPSATWTEVTELTQTSPTITMQIQYANYPSSAWVWTWTGAEFSCWIGIELRAV